MRGSILVVIIVLLSVFIWNHNFITKEFNNKPFLMATVGPTNPQDYILLGQKIDINTATSEVFEVLPGIGPKTAEKIIKHRERHGPFGSIEEMDNVKNIGPKTLERIRPYVTFLTK